jgi:xylulokinase
VSALVPGLFAGLDVSTQSCKLVVLDGATGEVVHTDTVVYDRDLPAYGTHEGTIPGPGDGVSESDPLMWIEAVRSVLGRLREAGVDTGRIRCIDVSGQQHGLVALNAGGGLARAHSKLWNDTSTAEECALLTRRVGGPGRMIAETCNTQRPGYTAGKILHLVMHEPDAYRRTATFLLPHDYVNWWLTGGPDGGVATMEPGDASGTALWDPTRGAWSEAVLGAIAPDLRDKLPDVERSDRTIGAVAPALAAELGLSFECRVGAGSGDNMMAAIGTGNVEPGTVTISLGTSGTAFTVLEAAWSDPEGEIASFRDATGRWLPLLCVSNMANGYEAVRAAFDLSHEAFARIVEETPPGNEGRILVPWYEGERTPDLPLAAPLSFGFGVEDLRPAVLARAVLEGHVLNLHAGFHRLPVRPHALRLTGGLSRSPAWRRTIADVFDVEVVAVAGEGAALGAAIHGAWVTASEEGRPVALSELTERWVPLDEASRTEPVAWRVDRYRTMRRLFRALTDRIRGQGGDDPFALRAELRRATGPEDDA